MWRWNFTPLYVFMTGGPASWSSGQSFWLMIMRSQVRLPALPWGLFLEGEDSHGDHGLGSLVELRLRPLLVLHIRVSPSTSSGQRNCASWASQSQKSVTLRSQPGGEKKVFMTRYLIKHRKHSAAVRTVRLWNRTNIQANLESCFFRFESHRTRWLVRIIKKYSWLIVRCAWKVRKLLNKPHYDIHHSPEIRGQKVMNTQQKC
jgi:hypothetical protein